MMKRPPVFAVIIAIFTCSKTFQNSLNCNIFLFFFLVAEGVQDAVEEVLNFESGETLNITCTADGSPLPKNTDTKWILPDVCYKDPDPYQPLGVS